MLGSYRATKLTEVHDQFAPSLIWPAY